MLNRRKFLAQWAHGFGGVALWHVLAKDAQGATTGPHFKPRAKNVIFLFMEGGPSHLDTFDHKPLLNKLAGQSLPASFGMPLTAAGEGKSPLLECRRSWK